MIRMPTVPAVFFQSATTLATQDRLGRQARRWRAGQGVSVALPPHSWRRRQALPRYPSSWRRHLLYDLLLLSHRGKASREPRHIGSDEAAWPRLRSLGGRVVRRWRRHEARL